MRRTSISGFVALAFGLSVFGSASAQSADEIRKQLNQQRAKLEKARDASAQPGQDKNAEHTGNGAPDPLQAGCTAPGKVDLTFVTVSSSDEQGQSHLSLKGRRMVVDGPTMHVDFDVDAVACIQFRDDPNNPERGAISFLGTKGTWGSPAQPMVIQDSIGSVEIALALDHAGKFHSVTGRQGRCDGDCDFEFYFRYGNKTTVKQLSGKQPLPVVSAEEYLKAHRGRGHPHTTGIYLSVDGPSWPSAPASAKSPQVQSAPPQLDANACPEGEHRSCVKPYGCISNSIVEKICSAE